MEFEREIHCMNSILLIFNKTKFISIVVWDFRLQTYSIKISRKLKSNYKFKTLLLLTFLKPSCFNITQIHSIAKRPVILISDLQDISLTCRSLESLKTLDLPKVNGLGASTPQLPK